MDLSRRAGLVHSRGKAGTALALCLGFWSSSAAGISPAADRNASGDVTVRPDPGIDATAEADPSVETGAGLDSAASTGAGPHAGYRLTAFPFAFSTPETGFAGGAGLLVTHRSERDRPDDPPLAGSLFFVYTQKHQVSIALSPELYLGGHAWKCQADLDYTKFPTSFYGIGNDTPSRAEEDYTYEGGAVRGTVARRVRGALRVGLAFEAKERAISGETPGGLIDRGSVHGAGGGFYAGAGPSLEWDSRNSTFFPTRGSWTRFTIRFHGRATGSDAPFDTWLADIRRYIPIRSHVLAMEFLAATLTGSPPFHELAQLGTAERGVYQGRLTDRAMAFVQLEDRFPIWRRLAGAVFVAGGDVCDGLGRYRLAGTKVAAGGGLRFAMNSSERIHLRADLGVSRYGGQIYFQFLEAF